ncbi:PRPP-binding protein [Xylariales sp. AK1849]|nr:PRPP-binding protein [Xylariales sp. AK1849]
MSSEIQSPPTDGQTWSLTLAGHPLTLPIIPLSPELAISLFMIIDHGVSLSSHIGHHLSLLLSPLYPEVIVAPATLGIPVAIEVSRSLGLDRYVILQKSPKVHLGDALVEEIQSITSKGTQRLLLDRQAVPLLAGKRVVVVDDVVASGGSLTGALELVRRVGADVVGIGVVLTEGWKWKGRLGQRDSDLVRCLGHIPQFEKGEEGMWKPMAGTA